MYFYIEKPEYPQKYPQNKKPSLSASAKMNLYRIATEKARPITISR